MPAATALQQDGAPGAIDHAIEVFAGLRKVPSVFVDEHLIAFGGVYHKLDAARWVNVAWAIDQSYRLRPLSFGIDL
jgi:hypothetical protein